MITFGKYEDSKKNKHNVLARNKMVKTKGSRNRCECWGKLYVKLID